MLDLWRYRTLILNLVLKDLKLKYRDSVLGFIWSLVGPLLNLVTLTFAFQFVIRIQMENYVYFLLVGILPWNFFATSLQGATTTIVGNASLIRKVYFPRAVLPVANVLFTFAQLLLALAVFLPALGLLSSVHLHWTAVLFIPLLLVHLVFTIGWSLVLAAITTTFRDVQHFTDLAIPMLFWVTPLVYPVTMAPPELQSIFRFSPLAAFAVSYQDVLFWGRVPDLVSVGTIVGWTVISLLAGSTVFRWYSPTLAEQV
jgi:lipopolysaccharide transport system permease protein